MANFQIKDIINLRTESISWGAWIMAGSTILSGGLGFLRDYLLAGKFGSVSLDVYFAAFKIPDFIYNILIIGGIVVAFLPLFSEYYSKSNEEAWKFTSNLLNTFFIFLIGLCVLLFVLAPLLMKIVTPGFDASQQQEVVFLTRILLLSPLLFGISSVFSGVLQYFNKFLIYGIAPILYNLGIIFGILFLAPSFGIMGVVLGVLLGAFLYLLIQIPPVIACGFKYLPVVNFKDNSIKRFFVLALPRIFGISVQQINAVFITAIASTLISGSLVVFTFSYNFASFVTGILGTSFAVAAFPKLSRSLAIAKIKEFSNDFYSTFWKISCLVIPVSILIFLFKNQIITLWLKHGLFSSVDSDLIAACLGILSVGFLASCLIPLIFRGFFAFKDTKTPTLISLFSVLSNMIMCLFFTNLLVYENGLSVFFREIFNLQGINDIRVLGLSLSLLISNILQFTLMIFFLRKRIHNDFNKV